MQPPLLRMVATDNGDGAQLCTALLHRNQAVRAAGSRIESHGR